ncbi:RNA-binding protein [Chromatiales bacterium (ex Bugula neritina AB1)]|nr:RNA-binding protein [Chromatiales bacterium (ex Bugula neritina AB1)]
MRIVLLKKQPVDLYKLIKFEGLASCGGEAKALISEGLVRLNGKVETRKRKKIIDGDSLQVVDTKLKVKLDPALQRDKH